MKITLLTPIIMLILTFAVVKGSFNGHHKGFLKMLISFVSIVITAGLSAFISQGIAISLSDFAYKLLDAYVFSESKDLRRLIASFENAQMLITAIMTIVISAVIYVFIFFALYKLVKLLLSILSKILLSRRTDVGYSNANGPWIGKGNGWLGAFLGGLCGFLITVFALSPIVGMLKVAGDGIDFAMRAEYVNKNTAVGAELNYAVTMSDDIGVNVIYYGGGKIAFDLAARASVNGRVIRLSDEVDTLNRSFENFRETTTAIAGINEMDEQTRDALLKVCDSAENSYLLSFILSEAVSTLAANWHAGDDFLGYAPPYFGEFADPIMDNLLAVLASVTPETVKLDITTLVNVSYIVVDSGLLSESIEEDIIISLLSDDEDNILNAIREELIKNPRMYSISNTLNDLVMQAFVGAIKGDSFSAESYEELVMNLVDRYNSLLGEDYEQKLVNLTAYAENFLSDYNLDIPDSVTQVVVDNIIKDLATDKDGYINSDQLTQYLEQYMSKK